MRRVADVVMLSGAPRGLAVARWGLQGVSLSQQVVALLAGWEQRLLQAAHPA